MDSVVDAESTFATAALKLSEGSGLRVQGSEFWEPEPRCSSQILKPTSELTPASSKLHLNPERPTLFARKYTMKLWH